MREIDIAESRRIQMDILSFVDGFCRANNITYSLAFGSLLGAVRHKGFIPWDDDIDICMLRDDYERFINLFSQNEAGNYNIVEITHQPSWHVPFAKVFDNRTSLFHNHASTYPMGVFIDVFPFDKASENDALFLKDRNHRKRYKNIVDIKVCKLSKINGLYRYCKTFLLKALYSICPLNVVVRKWSSDAQKRNNEAGGFVADNIFGLLKRPIPITLFNSIIDYPFEDRFFQGISDADAMLKATYGDYMKLPPENERVPKHEFFAYWK